MSTRGLSRPFPDEDGICMNTAPKTTKVIAAFVGERGFEIANEESAATKMAELDGKLHSNFLTVEESEELDRLAKDATDKLRALDNFSGQGPAGVGGAADEPRASAVGRRQDVFRGSDYEALPADSRRDHASLPGRGRVKRIFGFRHPSIVQLKPARRSGKFSVDTCSTGLLFVLE